MSSIFSSWSTNSPFIELVDKATSDLLPAGQEDIALNLEICDQVRAKDVKPEQAVQAIKTRLTHKNPNVVLLALGVSMNRPRVEWRGSCQREGWLGGASGIEGGM